MASSVPQRLRHAAAILLIAAQGLGALPGSPAFAGAPTASRGVRRVSDRFPELSAKRGPLRVNAQAFAAFEAEVLAYVRARGRSLDARMFEAWWADNRAAFRTRAQLSGYADADVRDFVVQTYALALAESLDAAAAEPEPARVNLAARALRKLREAELEDDPALAVTLAVGAIAAVSGALKATRDIVKGAITAGPIAGVVNAYLSPVTRVLNAHLEAKGVSGLPGKFAVNVLQPYLARAAARRERRQQRREGRAVPPAGADAAAGTRAAPADLDAFPGMTVADADANDAALLKLGTGARVRFESKAANVRDARQHGLHAQLILPRSLTYTSIQYETIQRITDSHARELQGELEAAIRRANENAGDGAIRGSLPREALEARRAHEFQRLIPDPEVDGAALERRATALERELRAVPGLDARTVDTLLDDARAMAVTDSSIASHLVAHLQEKYHFYREYGQMPEFQEGEIRFGQAHFLEKHAAPAQRVADRMGFRIDVRAHLEEVRRVADRVAAAPGCRPGGLSAQTVLDLVDP